MSNETLRAPFQCRKLSAGRWTATASTLALILTTALTASPQKPTKPAKPGTKPGKSAPPTGKQIFKAQGCPSCHSVAGVGGNSAPSLNHTGKNPKHTAQWFEVQITTPTAHNPNTIMPSYSAKIKGANLKTLIGYLSSLK